MCINMNYKKMNYNNNIIMTMFMITKMNTITITTITTMCVMLFYNTTTV